MSIIKTENICKSFGSVDVLKNVSLTVEPGEVEASSWPLSMD